MNTPELRGYQKAAVQYLHSRRSAGLFLEMGLGKTAITLSALRTTDLPVLVTAPKRVAENVWEAEGALWRPDLRVEVAAGPPRRREAVLAGSADIIVIGRDNLADAVPHAGKFNTFIIDELSGFKSRASARWKHAKKIAATTKVWGLTGTPTPQGLLDLWPQTYLMDQGARLGPTLGGFRERYFSPGRQLKTGVVTEWNLRPGADKRIHSLLDDLCMSLDPEGLVDLPPVTHNFIEVPMAPAVRDLYKTMKRDLVLDLDVVGGEIHTADTAAALSNRLSQLTAGFMYVDAAQYRDGAYDVIHTAKAAAVREIVEGTGSPVLVGYWYKAEADLLKKELGSLVHSMDEPGVVGAWNAGNIPVLMAHPASAGHGLNLQHGGHTQVWTTIPWSSELYQQFNARLPRSGQKHPVVIHHLMTPNSTDQLRLDVVQEKITAEQALLAHLEAPL
ncbi:MAG: DEAD/DEAH box helicase [Eubacteriales bacterium]